MELKEIKKYIKAHKLDTPSRIRQLGDIRGVLYKYLRQKGYTLCEIGELFNRDHATIMHGIKRFDMWQGDKELIENTKHVRAFLKYNTDLTTVDYKEELLKCETLIDFHRLQKQVKEGLI